MLTTLIIVIILQYVQIPNHCCPPAINIMLLIYITHNSIKKEKIKYHLKAMDFKVWVLQHHLSTPPLESWVGVKNLHIYRSPR